MHQRLVPASVVALLASSAIARLPIFNDATIDAHRQRQGEVTDASQAILARAEAESRDLTEAEQREITSLADEFDSLQNQIGVRQRIIDQGALLTTPRGRQTEPDPVNADDEPVIVNHGQRSPAPAPRNRVEPRPTNVTARGTAGFRNFGDFANAVRMAGARQGGELDARLRNAATTYGSEGVGAEGGFAVPPDFRADIMSRVYSEDSLITRTDRQFSSSNTLTFPTDMTAPWDSSGGIQAYWTGEAGQITASKPKLEEVTVKLEKLAVLVPVTEELLEDAPAMDGYLRKKAPEKIDFKLSYAIGWGNGAGMPLGFMNSPCLVTQAAEGAQTTDTINATNVVKMLGRMPTSSRRTAVWLIHPDAEAQLPLMTIGNQPVYLPPGGLRDNPFGILLGRPVIPHQICETVGDLGDIMLVDLNQYLTATKTGGGRDANGLKVDTSMHLWFDQDILAFKFTLRVAGQPWWSAALSQRDGSNTQSPFVTLASR
jgi:HK97 family phage major capsid protein